MRTYVERRAPKMDAGAAVCTRGHAMTAANTSWQMSGRGDLFRCCRQCNRERAAAWRERNAHQTASYKDAKGRHRGRKLVAGASGVPPP